MIQTFCVVLNVFMTCKHVRACIDDSDEMHTTVDTHVREQLLSYSVGVSTSANQILYCLFSPKVVFRRHEDI